MTSDSPITSVFAWPTPAELRESIKLIFIFLLFFYGFYGSAAYLADLLPYKFNVGFDFEQQIPFIPGMAAVYLSVGPMMLLSVFIIRREAEMQRLLKILCVQILIGFVAFLVFPVENSFMATDKTADLPPVYQIADLINLKNNELPSLHLCFAATMAFVYSSKSGRGLSALFQVWALSIALATLLIHEHNLLDLVAGYGLAWCGALWWHKSLPGEIQYAAGDRFGAIQRFPNRQG